MISVSLFYFSTIRFVKLQKRCCRLVSAPARKFQYCSISVCDVPGILWRRSAALDGPHSVTKLVNWNVWVNFFIWMVLGFKQRKKCWKRRGGLVIYLFCDHVCDIEHDHLQYLLCKGSCDYIKKLYIFVDAVVTSAVPVLSNTKGYCNGLHYHLESTQITYQILVAIRAKFYFPPAMYCVDVIYF